MLTGIADHQRYHHIVLATGTGATMAGIVEQAHQVALGEVIDQWPRGRITEFNNLSADIGQMANAMR